MSSTHHSILMFRLLEFAAITASGFATAATLIVDNASWFYDGFGIAGQTGETIRIQGQSDPVQIISIDYEANSST